MPNPSRLLLSLGLILALAGCSNENSGSAHPQTQDSGVDAGGNTIVIEDFVYKPALLEVAPGMSVLVINRDVEPHSVTSESHLGDFVYGAVDQVVFDTGEIAAGDSATFTISPSATHGTVVPYFCTVHLSSMVEASVSIE